MPNSRPVRHDDEIGLAVQQLLVQMPHDLAGHPRPVLPDDDDRINQAFHLPYLRKVRIVNQFKIRRIEKTLCEKLLL